MAVLTLLLLGVGLFVATNVDDLFLLLAWFAERHQPTRQIVAGQFVGQGLILAASILGALAVLTVAPQWVRLAGLVPLAFGVRRLGALIRGEPIPPEARRATTARGVAGVGLLTLTTGGDNLGAYAPVFAAHSRVDAVGLVAVSLAMTGAWCLAGYALAHHPRSAAFVRRYGALLLPLVLMVIGASILASG
jgi:cadmium resistance protein CadD (predicted permease)